MVDVTLAEVRGHGRDGSSRGEEEEDPGEVHRELRGRVGDEVRAGEGSRS